MDSDDLPQVAESKLTLETLSDQFNHNEKLKALDGINSLTFYKHGTTCPFVRSEFKPCEPIFSNERVVERYFHVPTLADVSIKFVPIPEGKDEQRFDDFVENLKREIDVCKKLKHLRNVIDIYGFCLCDKYILICMEYMYMSLSDLYKKYHKRGKRFPKTLLGLSSVSIIDGLRELKNKKIMHRDIKPLNVVINKKGEVKLCDFGTSRILEDSLASTIAIGTIVYWPPERWNFPGDNKYDVRSDVWSLGITLMEITLGRLPFNVSGLTLGFCGHIIMEFVQSMDEIFSSMTDDMLDMEAKDFIKLCLKPVDERPTMSKLIETHFYKEYKEMKEVAYPEIVQTILSLDNIIDTEAKDDENDNTKYRLHLDMFLNAHTKAMNKIQIYKRINMSDVIYVDNYNSLCMLQCENPNSDFLILIYSLDNTDDSLLKKFNSNRKKKQKNVLIDSRIFYDITERIPGIKSSGLYRYYKGKYIDQEIETYSIEEINDAFKKVNIIMEGYEEISKLLVTTIHEAFKPTLNLELKDNSQICQDIQKKLSDKTKYYWTCNVYRDHVVSDDTIDNCIQLEFPDGITFHAGIVNLRNYVAYNNNGYDHINHDNKGNRKVIMLDQNEIKSKHFKLTYDVISDTYTRAYANIKSISGWKSLNSSDMNIEFVLEKEFNIKYLSRVTDNCNGRISWKIDLAGFNIESINVCLKGLVAHFGSTITGSIKFRNFCARMDELTDDVALKRGNHGILSFSLSDIKKDMDKKTDLLEISIRLNKWKW